MTSPSPPPGEEIAAAKTLTDEALRRAALAIASSGGLLQRDIPKQLQPEDQNRSEEIVQALRDLGVVDSDLVVICSRGSTQVARVPDQEALERAATAGMRCACGRAILDETAEEALEISSLGRRLLDGSWWMSVLLMERLRELGIDYDSMLLEQKSGGDELDCFADLSGELALFELKDKEFSLGNAYSFGAKIGIHRPQHAVVVTTSHVGNDAKEHFRRSQDAEIDPRLTRRSRPSELQYIEGLDSLDRELRRLVDQISSEDASRVLRGLLPVAAMDAGGVVEALKAKLEAETTPPATVQTHAAADAPASA